MGDKGKGKSYWPFKKLKLDPNTTPTKYGAITGSKNHYSDMGGKNSRRTEEASYGSSGRGGSGESSGINSVGGAKGEAVDLPRLEERQQIATVVSDNQDVIMQDSSSTKYSRDTVEQHYKKTFEKDPSSYSVSSVTVQQQAAQESNFIGSAFFYNLNLNQVRDILGGDYLVVYARPKTSRSYPRGSATEVFEPNFKNRRITIYTQVPARGHPDEKRANYYLTNGNWAFGMLHFNGIRLALGFDTPRTRKKDKVDVFLQNFEDVEGLTGVFEETVNRGCISEGSSARFGIKEMFYEDHVVYGFQFIELSLCVINQITKVNDLHHVVAVKIPKKRDVASSFLLKQPIIMPHYSWYKFRKHVTRTESKCSGILANVEKVASDWYESEGQVSPGMENAKDFWDDMAR